VKERGSKEREIEKSIIMIKSRYIYIYIYIYIYKVVKENYILSIEALNCIHCIRGDNSYLQVVSSSRVKV
jgi:hypothetical protein